MTIAPEPWLPAYITVAVSLLVGLFVALRLPRVSSPLTDAGLDAVRDLETRYEQYIAQLRDLSQQQHRQSEAAFQIERAEYEQLAQTSLRQLTQARNQVAARAHQLLLEPLQAATRKDSPMFWARHPQLKGALWGAGAMGLALFLYTSVQQGGASVPTTAADAPHSSMQPAAGMPQVGGDTDAQQMKALAQEVKEAPDDADKLLRLAHMLLRAQLLDEAQTINDRALHLRPNDLEALTHAAVLSASSGDVASSDIGLDTVLKKDPTFVEAWFFRGMLAMQRGDAAKVQASFTAYLQHAPKGAQRDRIAAMLARMQE